ncbi:hypothetical protein ACYU03_03615 [Pseudomonas sp. X10]
MSDVEQETLWAEELESFRGKIYMVKDGGLVPLRLSRSDDKFTWGITPEYDWLQAGGKEDSPVFHFVFHSQTENRLHFNISGTGRNAAKKLGISRNGYLGLYQHAEVKHYWKIEPLTWTEQGLFAAFETTKGIRSKPSLICLIGGRPVSPS